MVASPNGQIVVCIESIDGRPRCSALWRGEPLLAMAKLELDAEGTQGNLERNTKRLIGEADTTWEPIVGKRSRVRDHYRELTYELPHRLNNGQAYGIKVRVYNDGFAFRYYISHLQGKPTSIGRVTERTTLRLPGNPRLWSYREEQAPAGPTKLYELPASSTLSPPLLIDQSDQGFVAIHEADLRGTGWLDLEATGGFLSIEREYEGERGWRSPWRVVQVGETLADLVDSDLLANLNPKADPDEFAWVKPGVALWDWRSAGATAKDGFVFSQDYESWIRFIDFAAENGIPYLVIDANWYGPEHQKSSNPFTGGVADDVRQAIDYGKQRGVGLILYLNDVAGTEYGIEKILQTWSDWGAAGIKYGFMKNRSAIDKVAWTRRIVRLCAENRLLVNFHDGPIPPAGCEAEYPNWVTREFCHAQSDARRSFTPSTFLMQMAVNQLAGPIDMNNGMFDLNESVENRPKVFKQINSTITAEAARTLIVYSGMTVIPDAPPIYARHPELFRFIAAQKMPWTENKTLSFELEEHITVMRQSGENYLVGSATNEEARTLTIPLDFLPDGKAYTAYVCEDADGAHYLTNREAYQTQSVPVNSSTVLQARLAPGGGHCVLITPKR